MPHDIATAPKDGTRIKGINAQGEEQPCYYTNLGFPGLNGWVLSEDTTHPNWHGYRMFYPLFWHNAQEETT